MLMVAVSISACASIGAPANGNHDGGGGANDAGMGAVELLVRPADTVKKLAPGSPFDLPFTAFAVDAQGGQTQVAASFAASGDPVGTSAFENQTAITALNGNNQYYYYPAVSPDGNWLMTATSSLAGRGPWDDASGRCDGDCRVAWLCPLRSYSGRPTTTPWFETSRGQTSMSSLAPRGSNALLLGQGIQIAPTTLDGGIASPGAKHQTAALT
jgi:hypothetical protein